MDTKPKTEQETQASAANMGMWLLIASLGMLFGASLVLYLVFRLTAENWPPPGHPSLPYGWLMFSTLVMIGSGFTLQHGLHSILTGREQMLKLMLNLTMALSIVFLVSQFIAWMTLIQADVYMEGNIYAGTFYLLTILHALHVLGGIIPLANITARANRGGFSKQSYQPVKNVAMYWHFLDAVWMVVFIVLLVGG